MDMVEKNSAAGATPVDTMRRVAGSQTGSSVALGQMGDRLGLLEDRLQALEVLAANAETRQTKTQEHLEVLAAKADARQARTHERLEALTAAVGDNADVSQEVLARMATKSAQDIQALSKSIEALGLRQDKAHAGLIDALDAVALEITELARVRNALQDEQRKTRTAQRRRLEDIARIQALSAERDALEIELQGAAARHRRAIHSAGALASPVTAPVVDVVEAPVTSADVASRAAAVASASPAAVDAAALLADARQAKAARDWPRARDAYAAYVAAKPRKASAWKQYGHMLKENDEFEEARAAYFRSLALSPSDVDTCLHLGHLLKNMGDRDLAAEVFSAALSMDPGFGPAKDSLGDLGFAIPETRPTPPRRGKAGSKLARWFYGKRLRSAQSAFSARKWGAAEGRYRGLLQDRPWDARLMIQIGHALKEQGKIDAAAQMYQRAVDQEPLNSDAHLHLGHTSKLAGDIDAAHTHYRRALRYWPQNPDALFELRDPS